MEAIKIKKTYGNLYRYRQLSWNFWFGEVDFLVGPSNNNHNQQIQSPFAKILSAGTINKTMAT